MRAIEDIIKVKAGKWHCSAPTLSKMHFSPWLEPHWDKRVLQQISTKENSLMRAITVFRETSCDPQSILVIASILLLYNKVLHYFTLKEQSKKCFIAAMLTDCLYLTNVVPKQHTHCYNQLNFHLTQQ